MRFLREWKLYPFPFTGFNSLGYYSQPKWYKKNVDLRIRLHIILQNIKLISISYMLYATYVKKKYDTGRQYYLVSSMFRTSVICTDVGLLGNFLCAARTPALQ